MSRRTDARKRIVMWLEGNGACRMLRLRRSRFRLLALRLAGGCRNRHWEKYRDAICLQQPVRARARCPPGGQRVDRKEGAVRAMHGSSIRLGTAGGWSWSYNEPVGFQPANPAK